MWTLAKFENAPYKTVRPKLNVSQNKSLILFTQGTPTPSRHGAFGNPIGSLGLARDQVSFTTPGVCVGNRRAFGRCGYRIVKCDEDRGQKLPESRRVRHRVTRFPLGIASREAPSPWTRPQANRSERQADLRSEPVDAKRAETSVLKVDSTSAAKPDAGAELFVCAI